MNNAKEKNSDRVIKIVLIAIIIVLLLHNCGIARSHFNDQKPTGNVDIIEITCDKDVVCEIDDNKEDGELIVHDKYITWNGQKETKIFEKSMFAQEGTIAPESSNTYQFIVKNSTKFNLKYSLSFIEDNQYGINMKFKLKKNDTYLVDEYVSAGDLNIDDLLIDSKQNDTFYLEWKWISSSNDTKIGKQSGAYYGLKIELKAESRND